jgi:hypothetical protein
MDTVLTKAEILKRLEAMRSKRSRGFTMKMFAEFACINYRHMESVTRNQSDTFTELTQRKLSRALLALEAGEAGPRIDILGRKFIGYSKNPKPVLRRSVGLEKTSDGFRMKVGIVNKYDFSKPRLDDSVKKRG